METRHRLVLAVLLFTITGVAHGGPNPIVHERLRQLGELFVENPTVPSQLFHANFLVRVPAAQIETIAKEYFARGGRVVAFEVSAVISEYKVNVDFVTEKGMTFPGVVGLSKNAPWDVNYLWLGVISPGIASLDEGVARLRELGAGVSLTLERLDGDQPEPLARLNPDRPMAIGSAFKLYILGELVRIIEQGKYRWKTLGRVRNERKSWPSGILHEWPDGAPLTLQSLASLMISRSDNTATDLLLFILGRRNVERHQVAMGLAQPELNRPFLSTREMFLLKNQNQQVDRLEAYLARDENGRRAYLREEFSGIQKDDVALDLTGPVAIDQVEWFASTADLCRAMDWLRRHTSGSGGLPARELLSINPGSGLRFEQDKWRYIGYKGGSEPGVLNLTWLLQRADGKWFALSASWNDPQKTLDEQRLISVVQALVTYLGQTETI